MPKLSPVSVIGAGSWGTAVAAIAADNGVSVSLWCRRSEVADAINSSHHNDPYLPGIELPANLSATTELHSVRGARLVVVGVPSHAFRDVFREAAPSLEPEVVVLSLSKGVEQGSLKRMTEVIREEAPEIDARRVGVLTGPNLAREIAARQPAASVVALADEELARAAQETFMTRYFRVYTNPDVVGCEVAGASKNVMALAAGIADGLRLGDNAKAALITRGLAELTRLGVALGGRPLTFAGLAGIGDLVATCMSEQSRNRHVGEELGRGRQLSEITAEMNMVAEGVKSTRAIVDLARAAGVEMPIAEHVAKVLYEGADPRDVVLSLMGREAKPEWYGLER